MKIDKKERNIILIFSIALALWFGFFLNKYYSLADGNTMLFYFIFLLAYCFLISKFFFKDESIKAIIIFFVVLLTSDILLPPYVFTSTSAPVLADNLKFSADYFIYSLFPASLGHQLKYYLTYVGFPVLMWGVLAFLFDRRKFLSLFKRGF